MKPSTIAWRNWLRPWEAKSLTVLDERQVDTIAERRRIRNRCYARARRDREQGDK